jgi:membrane fusion protein, heavy metal efflux system
MNKLNIFSFIIAFVFITSGCKTEKKTSDDRKKFVISDSLFKTLKIDSVVKCPLVNALTFTGQVSFNEDNVARIFPMVSGNITNISVQLGDHVNAGQRLGVIRNRPSHN